MSSYQNGWPKTVTVALREYASARCTRQDITGATGERPDRSPALIDAVHREERQLAVALAGRVVDAIDKLDLPTSMRPIISGLTLCTDAADQIAWAQIVASAVLRFYGPRIGLGWK